MRRIKLLLTFGGVLVVITALVVVALSVSPKADELTDRRAHCVPSKEGTYQSPVKLDLTVANPPCGTIQGGYVDLYVCRGDALDPCTNKPLQSVTFTIDNPDINYHLVVPLQSETVKTSVGFTHWGIPIDVSKPTNHFIVHANALGSTYRADVDLVRTPFYCLEDYGYFTYSGVAPVFIQMLKQPDPDTGGLKLYYSIPEPDETVPGATSVDRANLGVTLTNAQGQATHFTFLQDLGGVNDVLKLPTLPPGQYTLKADANAYPGWVNLPPDQTKLVTIEANTTTFVNLAPPIKSTNNLLNTPCPSDVKDRMIKGWIPFLTGQSAQTSAQALPTLPPASTPAPAGAAVSQNNPVPVVPKTAAPASKKTTGSQATQPTLAPAPLAAKQPSAQPSVAPQVQVQSQPSLWQRFTGWLRLVLKKL